MTTTPDPFGPPDDDPHGVSRYQGPQAPQVHVYGPPVTIRPSNGLATAGGVCGIVAAAISWIPVINLFSLVLSIIAVALGGVGLARANKLRQQTGEPIGRGMAITGIVLGALGLILAFLVIAALGSALSTSTT